MTIQPFVAFGVIDNDDFEGVFRAVFGQDVLAFAIKLVSEVVEGSVAGLAVGVAEAV